jgi:hypothetical protein
MRLIDADAIPWTDLNADMPNSKIKVLVAFADKINRMPTIEPEPHWIPCSERLPDEDHWLGGSGRQFSDNVMVTIVNHSDEDTWVDVTYTIDGEWACELPKYCKIVAWMPLPECYREDI